MLPGKTKVKGWTTDLRIQSGKRIRLVEEIGRGIVVVAEIPHGQGIGRRGKIVQLDAPLPIVGCDVSQAALHIGHLNRWTRIAVRVIAKRNAADTGSTSAQSAERGDQEIDTGVGSQGLQGGNACIRRKKQRIGLRRSARALAIPLRSAKDEEFVFLDRATEGEAKRVLVVKRICGDAGETTLCRDGGKCRVAIEFPRGTMKFVCAALIDDVGDRATTAAEFRAVRVGEYGYLSNRFLVCLEECLTLNTVVVIILAVDKEVVGTRTCAIDGETDAVGYVIAIGLLLDTGHRKCEFDRIQASNREILEFGLP